MYIYDLGQAFREVASSCADKRAIVWSSSRSVTFRELDEMSDSVAGYLMHAGVGRGSVVAIQNSKTDVGFAAMLACLKLGAAYTNFDYSNPPDRVAKMFAAARPSLVFADATDARIAALCEELAIPYIVADDETRRAIARQGSIPEGARARVTSADPAYIMFTSGSTGVPKGVIISHGSILNFIKWGKAAYGVREDDIFTNVNPIYFDNSVFDFYVSLFNGCTMLAVPRELVERPAEMLRAIDEVGCTIWFSVPSMLIWLMNMKQLTKDVLRSIRIFAFGGEGYPKDALRKLRGVYGERADLYNVYGPTEGTCICSAYKILPEDFDAEGLAPLGEIAPNFGWLILGEDGREADFGELCLTGGQLALGYCGDADRTAAAFAPNPLNARYPERMYRTGDLVEAVCGKLYFRGRVDNQIKHMGYRIELEEIEAAISRVAGVRECAVVHTASKNGLSKLTGCIATDAEPDAAALAEELKKYLPQYMIPNAFVFFDVLPKNANGKIDRAALRGTV